MGNCLVTKLKGAVDNNTLPKIGELVLPVTNFADNSGTTKIYWRCTERVKVRITNGLFYAPPYQAEATTGVTEFTSILDNMFLVPGYTPHLFIEKKETLTELLVWPDMAGFNIRDLKYSPSLKSLDIRKTQPFSVAELMEACPNLLSFTCAYRAGNVIGDLSDFRTNMTQILVPESADEMTGSLDHFLNFQDIVFLNLSYCYKLTCKRSTYDALKARMGDNFSYNGPIIEDE